MRQRAADIKGKLDVQTAPGEGMVIMLEGSVRDFIAALLRSLSRHLAVFDSPHPYPILLSQK